MPATDTMLWYGLCTFWTEDWSLLSCTGHGIPCCPHCGSPGFQADAEDWLAAADRFEAEGNPGYRVFLDGLRDTCHGRGVTTMGLWETRGEL